MQQLYNFCAGPAKLPKEVSDQLKEAIDNFDETGISLLSISHRDQRFIDMAEKSKALLRELLGVSSDYEVLFLHGGATTQFSMLAENLKETGRALYLDCGHWSKLAIAEGSKVINVDVIKENYDQLFLKQNFKVNKDYDYVHYIDNETIDGREFQYIPQTANIPLVCDMSSNLLSRTFDISKFDMIYAGAQKNLGIPGLTIVIIKKTLIKEKPHLPIMQSYFETQKQYSISNTPVVIAWYSAYLMFQWVKNNGGISYFEKLNHQKAKALYQYLDQSELFVPLVKDKIQSRMNVVFTRKDNNQEKIKNLIKQAEKDGFYGINGHRSLGGFRVSLYNAITQEDVSALIAYLEVYEKNK